MSKFTDSAGVEWHLSLSVGLLRQVREATKVDLGKAIASETGLAALVFGDPEAFAQVLWVLVEKQASEKGVSPEAFAEGLDGPAIEKATEAMLEAIADFFPRSRISAALKKRLPEMMTKLDEQLEKEANKAVDRAISTLSGKPGSSPASSASTPAP